MGVGLSEPNEDQCRVELAAVLLSDMLRRSPKLSRLLTYLCDQQLKGQADRITEYSIAHEALGRSADFDPQQDAVVRVDIHHLRKRLKDYYNGPGAGRAIQIVIPTGRYAPQFIVQCQPPAVATPEPAAGRNWKLWMAAAVALVLAIAAVPVARKVLVRQPAAERLPGAPPLVDESGEIRIAAGAETPFVDSAGRTWMADRYFTGGATFHRPGVAIRRTHEQELFQNGREGQFAYAIPLGAGTWELHLYFAETGVATDTLRSVAIGINGEPPRAVDIASDAGGPNTATMKVFAAVSPGADGLLRLAFHGAEPRNFLNGIEILPAGRGRSRPIRITAGDNPFRDHLGQLWLPDRWESGGRKSTRAVPIAGTPDAPLYHWERVGHFNYSIPVADGGLYTVTLHFSETWFASPNALGGVGSRIFDVYCNGTTLLENFDILREADGAANRAVVRSFRHVKPTPLGKIELSFVPVVNYALINAIEITPE